MSSALHTRVGSASFAGGRIGPNTCASVLVKVETSGALDFDGFTINAIVEHIAYGCVWMGEETVFARAQTVALWWFCRGGKNKFLKS